MHLTFDKQGVNDAPAIVHHHVTQQRNVAGLGIDLDHRNMRTIVEEHVLGIEEAGLVQTGTMPSGRSWPRCASRAISAKVTLLPHAAGQEAKSHCAA